MKNRDKKPRTTGQKVVLAIIIIVVIGLAAAVGYFYFIANRPESNNGSSGKLDFTDPIYSKLTGLEISDASLNSAPTYCIQIPNGDDGARPQAGLGQAAVVFEAIAERGITRFAAVFQNPTTSAIGPIRSLRTYYLNWDTPFNCTVVHAGGSDDALANIRTGGQRDLDESTTYMWRELRSSRAWNNLFTSAEKLNSFNTANGYTTSNLQAFPRLTPDATAEAIASNTTCVEDECITENVAEISIAFGASPTYNTIYTYDSINNKYWRSYANGKPHMSYECPSGLTEPNTTTDCGDPIQLAPSVVIAMVVSEHTANDGYHEDIATTGTGSATIFQNGQAIEGTWTKTSQSSQIIFRDNNGSTINLTPGQVWIAAVPQYGGRIEY